MIYFLDKKGKVIHDADGFFEYLNSSLGLTKDEVLFLCGEDEDYKDELEAVRESCKEHEFFADKYMNDLNSMCLEIQDVIIPKLESGKGGTKRQIAEMLKRIISYYEV